MASVREWICVSHLHAENVHCPDGWKICEVDAGAISHIAFEEVSRRFICYYIGSPTPEVINHCLNDLLVPRLLSLERGLVLHAGAIVTSVGAIGFLGPSGKGKSTITGSLQQLGLPILSDDSISLRRCGPAWYAQQVSPHLRLFPDSIAHLFPDTPLSAPLTGYTSKRHVSLPVEPREVQVAALFVIAEPCEAITIHRLPASKSCMELVTNAFALDRNDRSEMARRFSEAAQIAEDVPVFSLRYPRDYSLLTSVHGAIFDTLGLTFETEQLNEH